MQYRNLIDNRIKKTAAAIGVTMRADYTREVTRYRFVKKYCRKHATIINGAPAAWRYIRNRIDIVICNIATSLGLKARGKLDTYKITVPPFGNCKGAILTIKGGYNTLAILKALTIS